MSEVEQPPSPAGQPPGAQAPPSPQLLLQRLIGEVLALRNDVGTQLRPEVRKSGEALQALEAYLMVGLGARLAAELRQELAAAFEAERARTRRARRRGRLASRLALVLAGALLALEMRDDSVTRWSRRGLDAARSFAATHLPAWEETAPRLPRSRQDEAAPPDP